jgi:tetratricopeptide (TPR) repeat protein
LRIKNLWSLVFPQGRKSLVTPPVAVALEVNKPVVAELVTLDIPEEATVAPRISPEVRAELNDLAKIIRTKIARGEITEARTKIIEGLSIDKWHKDLNCLLASLYERDNEYRKAELIYKDLILVHDTDAEIYMKLGFSLSIQGKFEIAYEIYKKLLEQ